jgi:hypothetical protein
VLHKVQRPIKYILLIVCVLSVGSCVSRQRMGSFRVLPNSPNYLLRSPDQRETPFPDVLQAYNGFEPARSWMDLRPLMELQIENAYYVKGASRRGLKGFLGTEVARYEVTAHGLRLLSVKPMPDRPKGDLPVQDLISAQEANFRYYRFYFEIVLRRNSSSRGSVLLGANSKEELDRLSVQLSEPEAVCNAASIHCAVFPEACSVSVEMQIVVNGKSRAVVWGSLLASITDSPRHLKMKRLYAGRLAPIEINLHDPDALRLPLLPGDRITWN